MRLSRLRPFAPLALAAVAPLACLFPEDPGPVEFDGDWALGSWSGTQNTEEGASEFTVRRIGLRAEGEGDLYLERCTVQESVSIFWRPVGTNLVEIVEAEGESSFRLGENYARWDVRPGITEGLNVTTYTPTGLESGRWDFSEASLCIVCDDAAAPVAAPCP